MRPALLLYILLTVCCTAQQQTADAHVRTALNAFEVVVDPAYAFSVDACAAHQLHFAKEVEAGRMTPAQSDVALEPVRTRCQATRRAFDAIRQAQDEAADLVEAGRVQEAEELLVQIRARWAALGATSDGGVP